MSENFPGRVSHVVEGPQVADGVPSEVAHALQQCWNRCKDEKGESSLLFSPVPS